MLINLVMSAYRKAKLKRYFQSPRLYLMLILSVVLSLYCYFHEDYINEDFDSITRNAENNLKEHLKFDRGTGCDMPRLDPFSKDATRYDKDVPKIECDGQDWVKCFHSECRVVDEILTTHWNILCSFRDILYHTDFSYSYGDPVDVFGAEIYHLRRSDHVKVACSGSRNGSIFAFLPSRWSGIAAGFRPVSQKPTLKGREKAVNIMMFGFDSTSRIGFIRRMPKSYKYLTEELQATVLKSYNIVGDGTKGALFPMLTGKNMYELPNTRVMRGNARTCDEYPLLFYKLRDDGYRTAFFEDRPEIGAFQYWVNGFRHQPTDHYLRAFFQERAGKGRRYCVGATPQYRLMMNLTDQFMQLPGKKFIFTFVVDITHEDFNQISNADDDFVDLMSRFKRNGYGEDSLLVVMSDHGPRYSQVRDTPQGRLEERLPLMAFVLPERLKSERPKAVFALKHNINSLTTPYDIHATLLDAVGLRQFWNGYRIPRADIPRGMTLLETIPQNRSCSEAGVEPHWCACAMWTRLAHDNPLCERAGQAFVDYINGLTEPVRLKCVPRTLSHITWVKKYRVGDASVKTYTYQVKVTVDPGAADFEATVTHHLKSDDFQLNMGGISRTNRYGNKSDCIMKSHAFLSPYCYCRSH